MENVVIEVSAEELREGDVFTWFSASGFVKRTTVKKIVRHEGMISWLQVYTTDGLTFNVNPGERFIVVHRPWTKGKASDDIMLNDVIVALIQTGATTDREELKKRLTPLRKAMDTYELGKPLKK